MVSTCNGNLVHTPTVHSKYAHNSSNTNNELQSSLYIHSGVGALVVVSILPLTGSTVVGTSVIIGALVVVVLLNLNLNLNLIQILIYHHYYYDN